MYQKSVMAFTEMEQCQLVMLSAKGRELCEWKTLQQDQHVLESERVDLDSYIKAAGIN